MLEPRCSKRGPRPRSRLGACEEGQSWSARQARWVEPTCQPDPQGFGACYGWSGLGHGSAGQGQTGHRARVGSEPAPTLCKATEPRQNGRDGPPCPSRLAVVDSVTQKACMAHALPAGSAVLLGGAACWWTDRAGPVSRIPPFTWSFTWRRFFVSYLGGFLAESGPRYQIPVKRFFNSLCYLRFNRTHP